MTTHPTPAPGDVWNYRYEFFNGIHEVIRDKYIFVIEKTPDGRYNCLELGSGTISTWSMLVEEDSDCWRKVA